MLTPIWISFLELVIADTDIGKVQAEAYDGMIAYYTRFPSEICSAHSVDADEDRIQRMRS